jgi:L-seryl-tRNA(Ser) seleniumtransferase
MRLYNSDNTDNPYTRIGVRSFINCCGTRTIHGGTLMLPEVKQVMVAASNYFVNIDELMEGVGERLAELTGAEWGIVTSGAAAALYCATAVCVAGSDPEKMLRFPNTAGLKDRVIMLKGGRFAYDHAIRMVGVQIIEVETREELLKRLDKRVTMVALLGTHLARAESALRLEDIVELTRPLGIPVLVDAASEHLKHPNPYLTRGATMVAYSGGKYLRGPQCSGLLLGEKTWVKAAWVNAAPHHTLGRAMKTGKEEIMGLLAAVEYWATERDHEAERRRWEGDLGEIAKEVTHVATVTTEVLEPETPTAPVPRLAIRWDGDHIGLTGLELRDRLLEGEPRIMLDDRGATDTLVFILPFSLQPGEPRVVGSRIREVLEAAPKGRREARPPAVQVEGSWNLEIQYVKGTSNHRLSLKQRGHELTGLHHTVFYENPLSGQVAGNGITFSSLHKFQGTHISYQFIGTVDRDVMGGTVELGQSGQSAHGPLNQQEFGKGTWQARRGT